jgi:hypothetical protein
VDDVAQTRRAWAGARLAEAHERCGLGETAR